MIPSFPDFTALTLEHKDDYERLIAEYPPFSDISFATLNIWWNLEGKLRLSELNGNLVIDYHLPFDAANSGFCLVGKQRLNESAETIFDYLKREGRPVKLVHVPEFVIDKVERKDALKFEEELDYNEYILDSRALADLEHADHARTRRKVRRFKQEVEDREVEIRELDLSDESVREELFQAVVRWEDKQAAANDPDHTERQAIRRTLAHAEHFGIRHLGLYIDDELRAIILYHKSHDGRYFILHHLKVDYSIPYIFDYMTHHVANKAVRENVSFLNMEMDLGIEGLRRHKLGLRPVDFFRKYTVTPAET